MEYKILSDGTKIPMLGYGVFMIDKKQCEKCVLDALEVGYRHIDAAQIYGNETEVGNALIGSGISRNELYLTTKIWVTEFGYESTKKSIDSSLKRLKKIGKSEVRLIKRKREEIHVTNIINEIVNITTDPTQIKRTVRE